MTKKAARFSWRNSYATGAGRAGNGFSNGVMAMAISRSQRMLSLWLSRLATDRIRRSRDSFLSLPFRGGSPSKARRGGVNGEVAPTRPPSAATLPLRGRDVPLAVYGKRGNAEVLTAIDDQAARIGLVPGLALAQARAMHPALDAVPEDAET